METKFKKGDLVWVEQSHRNEVRLPGIIMDVRPWVLGGSNMHSWHAGRNYSAGQEVVHEPKRSEYLVAASGGEFFSWLDENDLSAER